LKLVDIQGRIGITSYDLENKTLNASTLESGKYILRLEINNEMITKDIVIIN